MTIRSRPRKLYGEVARVKKKPEKGIQSAASLLGKLGGAKGGRMRAQRMTPEERREAARKAVLARWAKAKKGARKAPEAK